jgi:hypothetical protein
MSKPATETRPAATKRTSKTPAKVAKTAATRPVAAQATKPRETAPASPSAKAAKPALLAGGNPQIAKAYGDAPANSGGLNSFLTCTPELDGTEVLEALVCVGALEAAREFEQVLCELGVPVSPSSQEDRDRLLERYWSDALDAHDVLSSEADKDLTQALRGHVRQHETFYLTLK